VDARVTTAGYRDRMTGHDTVPTWRDAWLPALLAGLATVELVVQDLPGRAAAVCLTVLACTLLVWRRRRPLVVAPLAVLVLLTTPLVGPQLNDGSVPVAILALATYSLGRFATLRPGLVGLAVCYAAFAVVWFGVDRRDHRAVDVAFLAFFLVPPYVLGRVLRRIDEQRRLLLEQQDLIEDRAHQRERLRIARELHDVLAHSLSAMVVQTDAARDLVRSDPAASEHRLDLVAATGRTALTETDHLLRGLGSQGAAEVAAPAPGMAGLDDLLRDFAARGLEVALVVAPEVRAALGELPPGLDLTAYRVLQEALNNAWRHGSGCAVLRLEGPPDVLRISVENPVGARRGGAAGSGLGLTGIAERVAVYDGSVTTDIRDGRHVLTAALPLPSGTGPTTGSGERSPAGVATPTPHRYRPGWGDVWPPALVLGLCAVEVATADPAGPPAVLLVDLAVAALLVWRRWGAPVVAPLAVAVLFVGAAVLGAPDAAMPMGYALLASYSLGRYARLVPGLVGALGLVAGVLLAWFLDGGGHSSWTDIPWLLVIVVPPLVLGRVVRRMAQQHARLREQHRVLEEQAVARERLRITRELHDVLVHSLGAMVVRAAATRDLLRSEPTMAEAGLDAISATGRAALADTGHLLHVLRDEEDELGLRTRRRDDGATVASVPVALGGTS
jgi:signal transduction histidine kinase